MEETRQYFTKEFYNWILNLVYGEEIKWSLSGSRIHDVCACAKGHIPARVASTEIDLP